MQVTVVGAGNMAKALVARFVAGGHTVTVHAEDVEKAESLVTEGVAVKEVGNAVDSDIVVLAVPYSALVDVAKTYGGMLNDKTVVDITNPVDFQTFQLVTKDSSAAEELAELLPNAHVVKAFNTAFAGTLAGGSAGNQPLDIYIAGDDADAKKAVATLVEDGGMRAVDVGPLAHARHIEGFQYLHMMAQEQLGTGWMSGIKIVS